MKQKKTEDSIKRTAKPSVRKVGTMLGSGALAVLMIGTVSIFALTSGNNEAQKDTKAAITNTKTTSVTEAETERDETYTSMNTVTWRKAGISEYKMAQAESETTTSAKATTTKKTETTKNAAKETKVNNVTMVATEIVNVREKADKNSEIEAIVATDEEVIVTAETSDGWYKVTYGDYSGYVMKDYLKKAEVTTTSAAKSETTTAAKKSETKKTTTTKAKTTKSETKKTETKKATTANSNSSVISYTDEEFDMLCYVLQGEVGNCSEQSKIAVANVIINRVKTGRFGSSISDVLTAPNQFTAINGYYSGRNKPTQNTIDCAKRALNGEDNSNGAVYYYAPRYCGGSTAAWFESLTFCMELDGQRYFK
ncbi:cell wall hydrolase [Ruminococcus bicirculans (ex Wegman et al. 2014)]|jgi:hypothetical protein|uniref:cell wall hydrolase n=1 Tax=Ruminococcus TaxID=1263 RepID=UPI00325C30B2